MFEDGPHGANMQCTSILMNLHTAALMEGHLPRVLHIGADNTPKETKKLNNHGLHHLAAMHPEDHRPV